MAVGISSTSKLYPSNKLPMDSLYLLFSGGKSKVSSFRKILLEENMLNSSYAVFIWNSRLDC